MLFYSHFPGKPGLTILEFFKRNVLYKSILLTYLLNQCSRHFPFPFVSDMCILLREANTFHILFDTIQPSLLQTSLLSSCVDLHVADKT